MTNSTWETEVTAACNATGAVCIHSKHPSNGARYNFDLECKFSLVPDKRIYGIPSGEKKGRLVCIGCAHFQREM